MPTATMDLNTEATKAKLEMLRGEHRDLDEIIARATGPGGPELGDHRNARGTCCLDGSLRLRPNYRTACRP